ncbi:hypothetical protein GCM10027082_26810 [Comamonas humi]
MSTIPIQDPPPEPIQPEPPLDPSQPLPPHPGNRPKPVPGQPQSGRRQRSSITSEA